MTQLNFKKKIDQTQNVITCELVLFTKEQPNYESANKGECGSSLIRHIDAYLHTLNSHCCDIPGDPGDLKHGRLRFAL